MLSRTSRILLIVAVLAGVGYLLVGRPSREPGEGDDDRLAVFDNALVDAVVMQRDSQMLRFVRQDSLWRMTAPVLDAAEQSTVASLLDALEHAAIARNLGATNDLAPFGLDRPAVQIALLANTDTLLSVRLGKRTVDEAWCYALRGSSRDLLLVPTNIARAASLPVNAYRNQRVLDFQLRDIGAFSLRTRNQHTVWTRRTRGWYALASGDTVAGDSVAVESVLRRLRGLRVAAFVADPDTARDEIAGTLTLRTHDGARFATVRFSRGTDAWKASVDRDARTLVLNDDIEDLLAHSTTELRDRRLLQFSPPDAQRIEFHSPSASGDLVRTGGRWAFPNPAMGPVDPDRAADLVRSLRSLKWSRPWERPPAGRDAAPPDGQDGRFHILILAADDRILDELKASSLPGGGMWYVTSRSSPGPWIIEHDALADLADRFVQIRQP